MNEKNNASHKTTDAASSEPLSMASASTGKKTKPKKARGKFLKDEKGEIVRIGKKPVIEWEADTVLNMKSGFEKKLLCTGPTFNLGDACVYSCEYCYVEDATRGRFKAFLEKHKLKFEDVVIRRKGALEILKEQLSKLSADQRNYPHVVYSSTNVDVAATVKLAQETAKACTIILEMTKWDIRLLSKSTMLQQIIDNIPKKNPKKVFIPKEDEYHKRLILGVSTGTFDDRLAKAIETGTPIVRLRIKSLHQLQDAGYRTFAMVCPSMPMKSREDYEAFAQKAAEELRYDRCEHVWAEPMNVRGDNFTRTIASLNREKQTEVAELLSSVCGVKASPLARANWEKYARATFEAHKKVVEPKKLRFLQYVDRTGDLAYWEGQTEYGAVILGKARKRVAKAEAKKTNSLVVKYQDAKLSKKSNLRASKSKRLSKVEKKRLMQCEETIEKGFPTFIEVGNALAVIRDSQLYRETHKTFESYCWERWQFGHKQAYRQIAAAKVVKVLSPIGDKKLPDGIPLPTNESQIRCLARFLGKPQGEEEIRVHWVKVVEAANGLPTAEQVKAQVLSQNTPGLKRGTRKAGLALNPKLGVLIDKIEKLIASTKVAKQCSIELAKLRKLIAASSTLSGE